MSKTKKYTDTYLTLQYKTITKIQELIEELRLEAETDQKKFTMYQMLTGYNTGLLFRLKGIIEALKETHKEEIEVPENITDLFKGVKEMFILREDGELVTLAGDSYTDLMTKLMSKE
jgi:uncharacterized Rmd1/YagE family protein